MLDKAEIIRKRYMAKRKADQLAEYEACEREANHQASMKFEQTDKLVQAGAKEDAGSKAPV